MSEIDAKQREEIILRTWATRDITFAPNERVGLLPVQALTVSLED